MTDLSSKVVVVTGAESGIGRAIAYSCAAAGASVVVAGLDAEGLAATRKAIVERGGTAIDKRCDIRLPNEVEDLFQATLSRFKTLSGVVANAGIIGTQSSIVNLPLREWQSIFDVNVTGTFNTVQAAARILIEQNEGGSIIATGSSSVLRAAPGLVSYAATKGAVHSMMQSLAVELGPHRIRVNTLVPGTTATDATRALGDYLERVAATLPMREVVNVDELGAYCAFALSDACPHLTGSLLKLDAGRTIA